MPARRRIATGLATIALVGSVAGCGADEPATLELEQGPHDITEPWQPVPFAISDAILRHARGACGVQEPNMRLTAVDARGGSKVMLVFAGPTETADCLAIVDANGGGSSMGGSSGGEPVVPPAPGAVVIESFGEGGSFGDGQVVTTLMGQAGPGVAVVEITTSTGRSIRASLSSTGWWAAWWPTDDPYKVVTGFDAFGRPTGSTQ